MFAQPHRTDSKYHNKAAHCQSWHCHRVWAEVNYVQHVLRSRAPQPCTTTTQTPTSQLQRASPVSCDGQQELWPSHVRLQKEYKTLLRDPVPHISAHPSPTNLLEWHFVLEGDKDTDYKGGVYHGKIVFPPQYPFKPPSLSLYTPNGRFATNTKLCLSMTDYHPESWNPMWSVGTILTGLLSFMHDNQPTTGSITTTSQEKQQLAKESLAFNLKNPMFKKLFPDWVEAHNQHQQQAQQQQGTDTHIGSTVPGTDSPQGVVEGPGQGQQHAEQRQRAAAGGAGGRDGAGPAVKPTTTLLTLAAVMMVVALAVGPIMHSWGSSYSSEASHASS